MRKQKQAVVLLSGGLDSSTCLALAQEEGYSVAALSFSYGQRHGAELAAAEAVAKASAVHAHRIVSLDLQGFHSALTDSSVAVPQLSNQEAEKLFAQKSRPVPPTYVPARNTIFLAYSLGFAEVLGAEAIFIGVNAVDFSGYPDCRPAFIEAFQNLAAAAWGGGKQKSPPRIRAPLQNWTKARIIQEGLRRGVDYSLTVSCYKADEQGRACGTCEACHLRRRGFSEAGAADPTRYAAPS